MRWLKQHNPPTFRSIEAGYLTRPKMENSVKIVIRAALVALILAPIPPVAKATVADKAPASVQQHEPIAPSGFRWG
jgi:hypothetical protein